MKLIRPRSLLLAAVVAGRRRRGGGVLSPRVKQPFRGYRPAPSSSSRFRRARAPGRSASGWSTPASSATIDLPAGAVAERRGARGCKAGEYRFDRPMTPLEVHRQDRARRGRTSSPITSRRADDSRDGEDLRAQRLRHRRSVRRRGATIASLIAELDPGGARSRGLPVSRHLRAAAADRRRRAGPGDGGPIRAAC